MSATASSALAQTLEPPLLRSDKAVAVLRIPVVVAKYRYPPLKEETGTYLVPKYAATLKTKQAPEVRAWSEHLVAVASIGAVCRTALAIMVISTLNSFSKKMEISVRPIANEKIGKSLLSPEKPDLCSSIVDNKRQILH